MLWVILAFHIFQCDASGSSECPPGAKHEQSSLVQRNHTSAKVMLASDASHTSARSQLFSEAFLASVGKHMVLALSDAIPEQATFPLEILIPLGFLGLMLAILGYFYLTRKGDQDVFLQKTETTGGSTAGSTAGSMFAPRPKARPVRPHEFQASAKSQGPQPSLVCICPNLVVPEKVECTILVPQVSSLESSQIIPLCDLSGGTILQLEVVLAKNNPNDIRLLLFSPSREIQFATCQPASVAGTKGFSLYGQDTSKQAQMRATEGSCLLTQQGRGSIRFRSSSPGTINASDDEGQLLAYSDPASADAQGLPRLTLKVGPKVDAGLLALSYVAFGLLHADRHSKAGC